MALATEERRQGYNDGRTHAANLVILSRAEAEKIMAALQDESTHVDVIQGTAPYHQSYVKGFRRRLIKRCEFYLAHTED